MEGAEAEAHRRITLRRSSGPAVAATEAPQHAERPANRADRGPAGPAGGVDSFHADAGEVGPRDIAVKQPRERRLLVLTSSLVHRHDITPSSCRCRAETSASGVALWGMR